jgi:2-C-methyl-D-erythritol 4-phosphate cytidylyltransferase
MYITAVVPAAGYGLRLNKKIPKALVEIKGRPIFIHTLRVFSQHPDITDIIVVAPPDFLDIFESKIRQYRLGKIRHIIPGGLSRQESVKNGLRFVAAETSLVLIHDAVRPFIAPAIISSAINEAKLFGAAVVGVPVKATIKKSKIQNPKSKNTATFIIDKTLNRANLWEIQTPQVFRRDLIFKAYNKFKDKNFTDDASLIERLGIKVRVVMGSYFNIKITSPEDLVFAQAILRRVKKH